MKATQGLPEQLGPAFATREARRAGVSRRAVDHRSLPRPFRGSRLRAAPAPEAEDGPSRGEHLLLMRALHSVLPPHAFFCGPSAAVLWDMPVPRATLGSIHVGVPFPATPPRRAGIAGRRFRPKVIRTAEVHGLRTLDAAGAWASLGKHLVLDDLVAAADALLWIPRNPGGFHPELEADPVCTPADLRAAEDRGQWLGAVKVREALELARTGSRSHPETLLRLRLAEAGLPEPELNADIVEDGRWLANGDLVFRAQRVCVEYHGAHHRSAEQFQADLDRSHRLRQHGWRVVELTSLHVLQQPHLGVHRVRDALIAGGW
ncbi:MAG: hypothetical protein LBE25_03415 [Arthrobacter sp.]|jgi:hypothetical protein|nr:hypothetical protein [Arthrobacter sp.]